MLRRSVIKTVALLPALAACGGGDRDNGAPQWKVDYVSDSPDARITAVAATAENEGWAVGMDADRAVILLRRQGGAWKPADLPGALSRDKGADLNAPVLAASGPDNVWLFATLAAEATGAQPSPGALRWDGQRWQPTPGEFNVRDVAVLASDDVWALEGADIGLVHHWDGGRWTDMRVPMDYPDQLSATGPDDIWASGFNGAPARNDVRPATARFDGRQWTDVPVPKPYAQADVADIVAVSRTGAWAVGTDLDVTIFALRWDGSTWTEVPDVLVDAGRLGIRSGLLLAGDGADGFVLAVRKGGPHQHAAGGTVLAIRNPKPVGGRSDKNADADSDQLFQPHDLTSVPGTREVWAAGAVGLGQIHGDRAFSRGVVASYTAS